MAEITRIVRGSANINFSCLQCHRLNGKEYLAYWDNWGLQAQQVHFQVKRFHRAMLQVCQKDELAQVQLDPAYDAIIGDMVIIHHKSLKLTPGLPVSVAEPWDDRSVLIPVTNLMNWDLSLRHAATPRHPHLDLWVWAMHGFTYIIKAMHSHPHLVAWAACLMS